MFNEDVAKAIQIMKYPLMPGIALARYFSLVNIFSVYEASEETGASKTRPTPVVRKNNLGCSFGRDASRLVMFIKCSRYIQFICNLQFMCNLQFICNVYWQTYKKKMLRRCFFTHSSKKCEALRKMLTSKSDIAFLMEAHNGISARIVEETGFKAIWGSGLSMSASLGVRDNNELSSSEVLQMCSYMSDATTIPILLDADTGYGNFNNARRLVTKLEQIGIAGACIEDKLFPKTNSLLDERSAQPLADVKEFAMKIRAMKDTQTDPNFCVVARVEAFIAGWPLEEALKRANAYADAGADAILMHSKRKDANEIEAFMAAWKGRAPVVIVPTNYPQVPVSRFKEIGVNAVIWANHNLRSSVAAMQRTTKTIFQQQSLIEASQGIASVNEVFRLQNQDEYLKAEDKYLPKE